MNFEGLKNIKQGKWQKYFGGKWSVLSASYWGSIYTSNSFSDIIDRFVESSIIVANQETGLTGYFKSEEVDLFSNKLGQLIVKDESIISRICDSLIAAANSFLLFIDDNISKDISWKTYKEYTDRLEKYYILHIHNKYAPEGLAPDLLKKYLNVFESARVAVEPVFMKTEVFINNLAEIHSKKTGLEKKYILCMVNSEFHEYLQNGILPDIELLKERFKQTVLVSYNNKEDALVRDEAEKIIEIIKDKSEREIISGTAGFPGKVRGIAKLVFDPRDSRDFKKGDILITKMTRPDYLPLMKQASAFVTDGGGILCHAAIVARELKKPCVIGTQVATERIKDGMEIEVDANKGIVRILKG